MQRLADDGTAVIANCGPDQVAHDPTVPPDAYAPPPNVARCTRGVNAPGVVANASRVDPGLFQALDSVGRSLFGSEVFSGAQPQRVRCGSTSPATR